MNKCLTSEAVHSYRHTQLKLTHGHEKINWGIVCDRNKFDDICGNGWKNEENENRSHSRKVMVATCMRCVYRRKYICFVLTGFYLPEEKKNKSRNSHKIFINFSRFFMAYSFTVVIWPIVCFCMQLFCSATIKMNIRIFAYFKTTCGSTHSRPNCAESNSTNTIETFTLSFVM